MANTIGTWTLFKRETKRFMKVWLQTVVAPIISNLLYLAIFGVSLHSAIVEVQGVSYLEFLVPGLIIMGIITNAYQNPSSSLIIMKYQEIIRDLMTIPLGRLEILIAFIGSAVFRAILVGFITYLTSIFFVDFTYPSITIIGVTSLLVSFFFSFLGMIVGIWADEFDKQAFILNFILMPMIFLGGVFYPISNLPPFFQTLSAFNPIVHMINLLRFGFTGIVEFPLLISFSVLGAGTLILGFLSYFLLRSGWRLQS